MEIHKKLAIAGLTAGLIGGGAAGAVLSTSGISGAQPTALVQDEDSGDEVPAEDGRPEPGERLAEVLAPLVEDGTIDQGQADAVIAALQEAMPERGGRGHHGPGRGMHGGEAAAEALGITTEELRDALRDGATIAEVAALQGVDVQVVIDAMVAEAEEHIAQAVENGRVTQEEADEKLAELAERITDQVNNGRPEGEGPRGPGAPEDEDQPAEEEGES